MKHIQSPCKQQRKNGYQYQNLTAKYNVKNSPNSYTCWEQYNMAWQHHLHLRYAFGLNPMAKAFFFTHYQTSWGSIRLQRKKEKKKENFCVSESFKTQMSVIFCCHIAVVPQWGSKGVVNCVTIQITDVTPCSVVMQCLVETGRSVECSRISTFQVSPKSERNKYVPCPLWRKS